MPDGCPALSASFFLAFHRESVDSDLLFSDIIGREAFQQIEREVLERFGESVIGLDYPCDEDDQFVFLRFYIRKRGKQIKVEILQNMGMLDDPEILMRFVY